MPTRKTPIISLDTAYAWLYRYEESCLRPASKQLSERMKASIKAKDFRTGWATLRELLKFVEPPCEAGESIEIQIICGWAAFHMRDEAEAIKMLKDVRSRAFINKHQDAIARWMLGYILWLFPYPNVHEAIIAWQSSIDSFDSLARQRTLTSEKAQWYHNRWMEMVKSLHDTIEAGGIRPILSPGAGSHPTSPPSFSYPPGAAPRPTSPFYSYPSGGPAATSIKRQPIRRFPVFGKIPAGEPANLADEQSGTMTFEDVIITFEDVILDDAYDDPHYRIVSLKRGESITNLPGGKEYYILKVSGNSMNNAQPEPINDGDYVLIHEQNIADPGDIVAAEIVGVDDRATLKRYSVEGGKHVLRPESNDPAFQTPIPPLGPNDKLFIRGIALAVLKPFEE